jgi:hypothetical protein
MTPTSESAARPTLVLEGHNADAQQTPSGRPAPRLAVARRRRWCAQRSAARHEIVASAAHLAAIEQPDRVNQLIKEHLT